MNQGNLTLLKAQEVITGNILLLLKYQKQATTAALNGEFVLRSYAVTYCLEKFVEAPSVTLIVGRKNSPIKNKVLDREFY